jgi:hypothetical protein
VTPQGLELPDFLAEGSTDASFMGAEEWADRKRRKKEKKKKKKHKHRRTEEERGDGPSSSLPTGDADGSGSRRPSPESLNSDSMSRPFSSGASSSAGSQPASPAGPEIQF